jgi:lysophospholipase L1-like esterase
MRICFVGDSFVNGTGDPDCLGWAGRVCAIANQQGHDITYYNLGVRRQTSTDIASRWIEEVSCRLPEGCAGRVVFSFGVNDTTLEEGHPRVALDESLKNVRRILSSAKQLFPILMVGPAPVASEEQNARIAYLSEQFASVSQALEVPYLDVFTPLKGSETWINEAAANDGAHPRSAGYSEFACLVQNWSSWLSWFD